MLSYRHAFHAGNHADVLKHTVIVQLLRYLGKKDKAYWYIDTHAGAGAYALREGFAAKTTEFETGIGKLWGRTDLPPAIADYVEEVAALNRAGSDDSGNFDSSSNSDGSDSSGYSSRSGNASGSGGSDNFSGSSHPARSGNPDGSSCYGSSADSLRFYPGSPYIAWRLMREQDRIRLFEMHSTEIDILRQRFHDAGHRAQLYAGDGFNGIKALLPPPSRRALVLIDPSYEDKQDYARTLACVEESLKRFATGIYAIWYPQVARAEAQRFPGQLKHLQAKNWLHVALTVSHAPRDGFGLYGSGLFILNPPYTLAATMKETLPWLARALGQDAAAQFKIEYRGD